MIAASIRYFLILGTILVFCGQLHATDEVSLTTCAQLLENRSLVSIPQLLRSFGASRLARTEFYQHLLHQMRVDSRRRKDLLKHLATANVRPFYDLIVVGGGIHAAILNSNLSKINPNLRILTVEASDTISKGFGKYENFFQITSPEGPHESANVFPGSPIQVRDWTQDEYPAAELLGQIALINQYYSISETLLETRAFGIEDHRTSYRVRLDDDLSVDGRAVVIATGLGEPSIPFVDELSLQTVREAQLSGDVQTSDEAMFKAVQVRKSGSDPLDFYANQTVAVLGAGQVGNYFIEFFLGRGPKDLHVGPSKVDKIFWLGQESRDVQEFRHYNKPRFHQSLADIFSNPMLANLPWMAKSIRKRSTSSSPFPTYELTYENSGGETISIEANKVILAAGFDNKAMALLGANFSPETITLSTPAIGKQVLDRKGRSRNIFLIGPAAKGLATREELSRTITKNPVSINVLGEKTASSANWINSKLNPIDPKEQAQEVIDLLDHELPGTTVIAPPVHGKGNLRRIHNGETIANLNYWLDQNDPSSVRDLEVKVWPPYDGQGMYHLLFAQFLAANPRVEQIETELGGTNFCIFNKAHAFMAETDALRSTPAFRVRRILGLSEIAWHNITEDRGNLRWCVRRSR